MQEEKVGKHQRNPWPVLPILYADNALQRLLWQSASDFQQSFSLVAKGNLNKRNKAVIQFLIAICTTFS